MNPMNPLPRKPSPPDLPPLFGTVPRRVSPFPIQLPYNVAFGEVLNFVTAELKAQGTAWNDQAVQDAVCTILIAASKQKLLVLWERE